MKIRSLLLGSIAAAGLTTGAFAADVPQVLTTLNLCDALGLTGLTVSSDNNCLQISGEVKYEFQWGDFKGINTVAMTAGGYDNFTIMDNDNETGTPPGAAMRDQDWYSKVEAYLKFVGTADTDVGPAKVVIKLKDIYERATRNENNSGVNGITEDGAVLVNVVPNVVAVPAGTPAVAAYKMFAQLDTIDGTPLYNIYDAGGNQLVGGYNATGVYDGVGLFTVGSTRGDDYNGIGGDDTGGFVMDEAYVAIGGATVLSAGKKGSIRNIGDDAPFNWLGLFLAEKVDTGVLWTKDLLPDGGHVIQLVHDFGNGLSGGVGLENLQGNGPKAGTAVGVLAFAGEKITAHITGAAGGVLDGTVENFGIHAGITGTFNMLKIRGAVAADNSSYVNALASAEVTFDMFKIAWSGEFADKTNDAIAADYGAGASLGITVTDGITINLGGRWYHDGPTANNGYQAAAQIVAAVTETLTVTGEIGVYGLMVPVGTTDIYGKAILAWNPGGGFTTSLTGEVHQNGGYKATFKAGKAMD